MTINLRQYGQRSLSTQQSGIGINAPGRPTTEGITIQQRVDGVLALKEAPLLHRGANVRAIHRPQATYVRVPPSMW